MEISRLLLIFILDVAGWELLRVDVKFDDITVPCVLIIENYALIELNTTYTLPILGPGKYSKALHNLLDNGAKW